MIEPQVIDERCLSKVRNDQHRNILKIFDSAINLTVDYNQLGFPCNVDL